VTEIASNLLQISTKVVFWGSSSSVINSGKEEPLKLEAKDVLPNINCTQATERAEKCRFLVPVSLTFDLDYQTLPSKRPNTSSMEFGADPFSGTGDISYTKTTD